MPSQRITGDCASDHADMFTMPLIRAAIRPSSQGDGPPSQYPCRPLDDGLLQFKKALAAAEPLAPLDDLPPIPKDVRELVLDRIDAALVERRIHLDCELYAALLMALMPADFEAPDEPPAATDTAPRSPERVEVYALRCRREVAIFHAADAAGDQAGAGIEVEWSIGRTPKVKGFTVEQAWRAGRKRRRCGTVAGAKPKPRKKAKKPRAA